MTTQELLDKWKEGTDTPKSFYTFLQDLLEYLDKEFDPE